MPATNRDVFGATYANRKWTFCIHGQWFCPNFRGKNGRVITYQKVKALLPVDLRRPKVFLLNFLMSPWFESWHRRHIVWVEFVVIFLPAPPLCLFVFCSFEGGGGGGWGSVPYSPHLKNQHSKILFDL